MLVLRRQRESHWSWDGLGKRKMLVAVAVAESSGGAAAGGYTLRREYACCGGEQRLLESGFEEGEEMERGKSMGKGREVWGRRWTT